MRCSKGGADNREGRRFCARCPSTSGSMPSLRGLGRRVHREWVEEVFAPQLASRCDREELVDLLVVATDLLTWKILRRDGGMDRSTTCERTLRLVQAILPAPSKRS